jgi:hypothetical protein
MATVLKCADAKIVECVYPVQVGGEPGTDYDHAASLLAHLERLIEEECRDADEKEPHHAHRPPSIGATPLGTRTGSDERWRGWYTPPTCTGFSKRLMPMVCGYGSIKTNCVSMPIMKRMRNGQNRSATTATRSRSLCRSVSSRMGISSLGCG